MNAFSSLANLDFLMNLLVHSLVAVPLVGTVVGLLVMVVDFRRRAEFKSARFVVDRADMAPTSTSEAVSPAKRAPTPAELAAVAISEAAESAALVGVRIRAAA